MIAIINHGCGSHEYGSHGCDRMRPFRMVIIFMPELRATEGSGLLRVHHLMRG